MSSASVPKRTDRHEVLSEGVVEMGRETTEVEAAQPGDLGLRIRGPRPWQQRKKVHSLFDLIRENPNGALIVDPPRLGRTKLIA